MKYHNIIFIVVVSIVVILPAIYIGAVTTPDPPKLTNGTVGAFVITLDWSIPAHNGGTDTISYNIKRSADGSTYTSLTNQTGVSYTDSSPLIQTYGYYRIYSNDTNGQSPGYAFPLNQTITPYVRTHIPFDGIATNQGLKADTPTMTGGTYITGHNGQGINFTGTDYATFPNESNYDWDRTTPMSYSFWVKYSSTLNVNKVILSKGDDPLGHGSNGTAIWTDGGNLNFEMDGITGAEALRVRKADASVGDNTWHHVIITYDGSSSTSGVRYYYDGIESTPTSNVNTLASSILNNKSVILGDSSGHTRKFGGGIDDFRIFYNYKLSASEAQQIYYERLDTANVISPTEYSTPPTSLVASAESSTQIDLDWVAGTMTNVNGYMIERETPSGTGWATIVSNTTNTNLYYNNTGLTTNILYNYRVSALNGTGYSTPSNTYEMTTFHLPDAVDDLSGVATDLSTINLSWSAPTSYAPAITGYMINATTPTGEPVDILNANTGSTATTATALNLLIGQEYSFRVSAITVHGENATGNIWNGSTIETFVIGNLTTPDVENTNDFSIFFDRTDVNSTAIQLDVTYPNSYDLSCDFKYKYARTNQTYSGLTTVPDGADDQTATFTLINATGDLVQVRCWDPATGDESTYVITITDFPFLQQVNALRSGEYGTYFQIGAFDGVMLIVIFLGMIGLNRTTPIVGIIFVVITTFAMTYFGLITYPVIMYPALIMMIVWAFVTTRKDD